MTNTTIVTAYYPITKSKHRLDEYYEWIKLFCKIPKHMIIYTEECMYEKLLEYRSEYREITSIIIKPFHSYDMTTPEMMNIWRKHHDFDKEKHLHSPELYAVWALRHQCVHTAIQNNIFNSRWFVWCDIGIQRHRKLEEYYNTFTNKITDICVPGRISFLEVQHIDNYYVNIWKNRLSITNKLPQDSIGAGCIVGDREAWEDFSSAYTSYIMLLDKKNIFIGKEQDIFFRMLIERVTKNPFRLFHAQQFCNVPYIYWMSFPVILGGNAPAIIDTRFEENDDITI